MIKNAGIVRVLSLLILVLSSVMNPVQAGQFNVQCAYSHTLPDDSIVRYGLPGFAMQHDFFGNISTDAFSELATLNATKITTCNVLADMSAYWVPQLKRKSGIVLPDFQKTYYRKNFEPPVNAIPQGLEMLAGSHRDMSPNLHAAYFCANAGYTAEAPTSCPVVDGRAQLDIVLTFPDCWDGTHIRPDFSQGVQNMAYHNPDGSCPAAYPVQIQQLDMNIQYSLGNDGDLSDAQLSMDPVMKNGVLTPMWGSLYTAHADFINAWKPDSLQYATDHCSNQPVACNTAIPTYFSAASADSWLDASGVAHDAGPVLRVGSGDIIFLKFPTPANTDVYPYRKASLQTFGRNVTDSTAEMMRLYAATTSWNDATHAPVPGDCSTRQIGGIYLDGTAQSRLNDVDAYVKQQIADKAPDIAICIRNGTGRVVEFNSREQPSGPALFLQ